ncbi:MAG: 3-oxoacyl-ACP synthase [Flavobacteriales bacterium]|nr:MAG: 3-oxoacyl-ACP synthase [Flavobacteriales bacterium]
MSKCNYSVITATGSYIPERIVSNKDFLSNEFYDAAGQKFDKANEEITEKFKQITEIEERRYVTDELVASDIAYYAAVDALNSSNIDKEGLDYIIVAHNFGDVRSDNLRSDFVPTIAARVKHKLGIENPYTIPYDLPFGCPGWLQGLIQADYYIKSGDAKRILVIGAETLSRISDPHDRDSMIYSDGAGAVVVEAKESSEPTGVLSHKTRSDTLEYAYMLRMDKSYNTEFESDDLFLKMNGRKLYQYALKTVPQVAKDCIEKAGLLIEDIKKVLIHQANAKMDDAILTRVFDLYNIKEVPKNIMPMTISWLGNSSVATLPTLYDLLLKGELSEHELNHGDIILFASVGAGMNINSVVYKV